MFWTYLLRCTDGHYYAGHTDDLELRLAQHRSGECGGYTSTRLPVELAWSQDFPTRHEALEAERRIKGWSRKKKEGLIAGDCDIVSHFAKPPSRRIPRQDVSTSSTTARDEREDKNSVPVERSSSGAEKTSRDTPSPVIVLVRPQLGENIGKAARAMLNFGLTELRLVEPRDGWPNPAAGPAAAGADLVLEKARVFATTAEAVADCAHVYATTVRKRGVTKPVLTPAQAAREAHGQIGRSAFLFGPERSGLETDDVALARKIVTAPINPEFGSLNLAQAVILVAYELSKHVDLAMPTEEELLPPAPQEELEGLIGHFEQLLVPRDYYLPASREEMSRRNLRGLLTKPGWNHLEVRTLRGVLSTLARKPRGD